MPSINTSDLIDAAPDGEVVSAPADKQPLEWNSGVEAAAKMLARKAEAFANDYGYEDMGGLSFGRGATAERKLEYYNLLCELEEEVRALIIQPQKIDAKLRR